MRTLTEKYNGVLRGIFSKDQFLRDARMEQSHLVTQYNSYNDAVNILTSKGLIFEYGGSDGDYEESKSTGGEAEKHYDLGLQAFLNGDELKASEHYQEALRLGSLLGWTEIDLPPYNTLNADSVYEAEAPVTESAGAERFLDNLFKIANEELKAGRITEDEYDYVLNQIDTKEYDLLELGHDPSQAFDKLIMQAQSQRSISTLESAYKSSNEVKYQNSAERILRGIGGAYPDAEIVYSGGNKNLARVSFAIPTEFELVPAICGESNGRFFYGELDSSGQLESGTEKHFNTVEDLIMYCLNPGSEISTIDEGPAKNNPKIEKIVAGINDLIAKAVDSDGDPIGVVDPTSTWEEPYVYEPIQYKNGQLKIVSKSPYQKTSDVDIILSRDMEFDGIPTLRLIMRMYKKAIKQAGKMSNLGQEIEEKKLTAAEKAGKEKIVKGLKKSGMSAKDPSTYAIATSMAKDLYEEEDNSVKAKYLEIVSYFNNVARSLDPKESYELHNMLKDYFNRMFEGTIEEAMTDIKRNDKLEHIPSGTTFSVSVASKTRISGFVTVGGTVKGRDYRVHDLIAIRPIEVGAVWKKLPAEQVAVTYHNLAEAKEEGYQSPKPELPLDVLHHGIRFELDKKGIGNTPTEEEYMKAYKAACKNLEKDLLHYKKEEGAVEGASSKSDEMVKVKLKESFKKIIRNILSENASNKKAFDLNGKPL